MNRNKQLYMLHHQISSTRRSVDKLMLEDADRVSPQIISNMLFHMTMICNLLSELDAEIQNLNAENGIEYKVPDFNFDFAVEEKRDGFQGTCEVVELHR